MVTQTTPSRANAVPSYAPIAQLGDGAPAIALLRQAGLL
jgi:hypothetical protein